MDKKPVQAQTHRIHSLPNQSKIIPATYNSSKDFMGAIQSKIEDLAKAHLAQRALKENGTSLLPNRDATLQKLILKAEMAIVKGSHNDLSNQLKRQDSSPSRDKDPPPPPPPPPPSPLLRKPPSKSTFHSAHREIPGEYTCPIEYCVSEGSGQD